MTISETSIQQKERLNRELAELGVSVAPQLLSAVTITDLKTLLSVVRNIDWSVEWEETPS